MITTYLHLENIEVLLSSDNHKVYFSQVNIDIVHVTMKTRVRISCKLDEEALNDEKLIESIAEFENFAQRGDVYFKIF